MRPSAILVAFAPITVIAASPVLYAQPIAPPALEVNSASVAAQQHFDTGRRRFTDGDYVGALTEFRASLQLYSSPNTQLYIGLCLQRSGHATEAWTELSHAHTQAEVLARTDPRYTSARDIAQRELTTLEARVARVTLRIANPPEGLRVRVGGTVLSPSSLGAPFAVEPGTLHLIADAPGYQPFVQDLRLTAGGTTEVEVVLRPGTATPESPSTVTVSRGGGVRIAGFVIAGLGVAALGTFAALGIMAGQQYDDLVARCHGRCTGNDVADLDSAAQTQLLANVSLGVGTAAVLAGVVMIAVGGPRRVTVSPTAATTASIDPFIDPSRGTFGVRGVF